MTRRIRSCWCYKPLLDTRDLIGKLVVVSGDLFRVNAKRAPIMSPQNNLARARPMKDFFAVYSVQLSALVLSVMLKMTGKGSAVGFSVVMTVYAAQ